MIMVAASCPVCPRRPSRSHGPSVSRCRCGIRSAACRPVKSSTSPASAGSGKTTSRLSTTYGSRPVLASVCRARMAPPGTASTSVDSRSPATASLAATRARAPSCSIAAARKRGDRLPASRATAPLQTAPANNAAAA